MLTLHLKMYANKQIIITLIFIMKYYSTHYIISVNSDLEIMLKVASWNAEMRLGQPQGCAGWIKD